MLLMELPDQLRIEDALRGNPRPLLWAVPVHQVLETSAPGTGAEKAMDDVDRTPWHELGQVWSKYHGHSHE